MIYLVTTFASYEYVERFGWYELQADRTIGYFTKYEDAKDAVENNYGDICETTYEYAIIEGVEEGLYSDCDLQELYEVRDIVKDGHYNMEGLYYERVEAPEGFFNGCGKVIG